MSISHMPKSLQNFVRFLAADQVSLGSPNPDHVTWQLPEHGYRSSLQALATDSREFCRASQDQPFLAGFADSQQGWRSCLYITAKLLGIWALLFSLANSRNMWLLVLEGVDLDYRSHNPCHPLHTGPGELKNENVHASSAKMMSLKSSHGGLA